MADIAGFLTAIKNAVFGKDVRGAFCDAIEAINEDVSICKSNYDDFQEAADTYISNRLDTLVSDSEVLESAVEIEVGNQLGGFAETVRDNVNVSIGPNNGVLFDVVVSAEKSDKIHRFFINGTFSYKSDISEGSSVGGFSVFIFGIDPSFLEAIANELWSVKDENNNVHTITFNSNGSFELTAGSNIPANTEITFKGMWDYL